MLKLRRLIIVSTAALQLLLASVLALEEDCTDFWGESVRHGEMYTPGPNVCSTCVCYHSEAMFCKAIYCNPSDYMFCTKFRVGEKCCEITCYDSDAEVEAARNKLKNRPRKFFGIPIRFSLSHAESSIAKSSIINAITIAMVALLVSQLT